MYQYFIGMELISSQSHLKVGVCNLELSSLNEEIYFEQWPTSYIPILSPNWFIKCKKTHSNICFHSVPNKKYTPSLTCHSRMIFLRRRILCLLNMNRSFLKIQFKCKKSPTHYEQCWWFKKKKGDIDVKNVLISLHLIFVTNVCWSQHVLKSIGNYFM